MIGAYQIVYAPCEKFHDDPELVALDKASVIPCNMRGIACLEMGDFFLDLGEICRRV
jgi:hypothetical protein